MLFFKCRSVFMTFMAALMMAASNIGGPAQAQTSDPLEISFTITTSINFDRNYEVDPIIPITVGGSGGNVFSISPSLPLGLNFDTSTGTISGTPTTETGFTNYTVTVTDDQGTKDQATVRLRARSILLILSLSSNTASLIVGQSMDPVLATVTEGNGKYTLSISPTLPAGLTFDTTTGTISGIPEQSQPAANYRVRASEWPINRDQFLQIEINNPALTIAYGQGTLNLTRDVQVPALTPVVTGGEPTYRYAISPALPAGLIFSEATGTISGTPSAAQDEIAHTITLTDGAGATATVAFTLSVDTGEVVVALSETAIILTSNEMVSMAVVSVSGGDGNYRYAVSPALPAGLTLDSVSGILSGMASGQAGTRSYTVTVTDGSGASGSAVLSITIEGLSGADEQEVIDIFMEATTTFMATRINRILAAEPRGYRFDQRSAGRTGILSGQASDGTAMFFMSGNTVTWTGMHVWTETSLSRYDYALSDDRDSVGSFAMISTGVDFLLSPTVAVGAMVQFDHLSETSDDLLDISGTGWLAGPYVSGQLTEDLFFNVKLGFGASRNDAQLDVFGDGMPYEGSFRTKRTQVRGAIYGNHILESGVTLSPEVSLAFMRESQEDYLVSNGVSDIDVTGVTVDLGQLGLAVMVEMPIGSGPYIAFAEPKLNWTFAGSSVAREDPMTGALALGVRTGALIGWDGSVAIRLDGIGSDRLLGQTLELRLHYVF